MNILDLAIALWPQLEELRWLDGWTWRRGEADGDLNQVGLCGYRTLGASGMWAEMLWIYGPEDCVAVRFMVDGPPTWKREGSVAEMLIALARLPHPGQPGAPLTAINVGLPVGALPEQ